MPQIDRGLTPLTTVGLAVVHPRPSLAATRSLRCTAADAVAATESFFRVPGLFLSVDLASVRLYVSIFYLFFEWVETSLQNLFGIRKHHDAGPDIGKRSAFSRPSRRIGGFCIGETPQQGAHTRAQHHIIFACLQAHNQSQKRLNISSFFSFFLSLPLLQNGYTILSHYGAEW